MTVGTMGISTGMDPENVDREAQGHLPTCELPVIRQMASPAQLLQRLTEEKRKSMIQ